MALAATTYWEINGGATANNVNGGGFNTGNANFMTDLTTDTNTANTASPVVSSATYNFVAGDVGAWVFIKSGTNWYANTFYKIASVASNKATLQAAVGQGLTIDSTTNTVVTNTSVGVASTGTPTGGTFGIDYSQGTSSITNNTDLASTNGTTNPSTITSAGSPFGRNHVGNIIHVTAGTSWTAGWYEIVSVSGSTATLDRAVGSSATLSSGTFALGGAMSMNSTLDDDFFEILIGGNNVFFNTAWTVGEAVSVASTSAGTTNIIKIKGYQTYRYDDPTGSSRPTITGGANSLALGQYKRLSNFIISGTASPVISTSTGGVMINIKATNTNNGAGSNCITNSTNGLVLNCESVSQNGNAINVAQDTKVIGCYMHDSNVGLTTPNGGMVAVFNIMEANTSYAIKNTSTASDQFSLVINNTLYGREAKKGIGIEYAVPTSAASNYLLNNILYGLDSGVIQLTAQKFSNFGDYNDYYNITTDVTLYGKGVNDIALNPGFTDAVQLSGTTGSTTGSVLTDSGADFSSVEDNVDYLHTTSGTGVTVGVFLITSHTSTTLTVNNSLGTSSSAVTYWVTTGHNFAISNATVKSAGYPGAYQGGKCTSYLGMGGVQGTANGNTSFVFGG